MLKLSHRVRDVIKGAAIAGLIGTAGVALSVAPVAAQHRGGARFGGGGHFGGGGRGAWRGGAFRGGYWHGRWYGPG